MRLVVTSILAAQDFGAIFAGVDEAGAQVRVRTFEPVWPVVGEVYEVKGAETTYKDRWGRAHRQIDQATVSRVRSSGRLLGPWLQRLPGVGETRAGRLMAAFGLDLLEVLDDAARLEEIAKALEPSRPALAMRLAATLHAAFQKHAEEERDRLSEAAFYQKLEERGVE